MSNRLANDRDRADQSAGVKERLPGTAQLRYVAQRRRSTDAHPYVIVTSDFAELRGALPPPVSAGECVVTGDLTLTALMP